MTAPQTPTDRCIAELNAKRREMHGENWQNLNWYGQPLTPAPSKAPSYSPFLKSMARKIIGDFDTFTRGGV